MGKLKHNATEERKNVPKISSASRKLAAKRLEQLNPGGLPNFMREIKCQSREPLAPISSSELVNVSSGNSSQTEDKNVDLKDRNTDVKPEKNKNNNSDQEGQVAEKKVSEISVMMTKQPSLILDDNVFTFKPKVSTASARLVENLGTDFMTRQQQHLEKQKKFVSIDQPTLFCFFPYTCHGARYITLLRALGNAELRVLGRKLLPVYA